MALGSPLLVIAKSATLVPANSKVTRPTKVTTAPHCLSFINKQVSPLTFFSIALPESIDKAGSIKLRLEAPAAVRG